MPWNRFKGIGMLTTRCLWWVFRESHLPWNRFKSIGMLTTRYLWWVFRQSVALEPVQEYQYANDKMSLVGFRQIQLPWNR